MTTFIHAKRTALAVASFAFFSGFSVQAVAQNTNTAQGSATKLAPVVVTATRSETRANRVISDISVIDRATIDKRTGQNLAEILSQEAGINLTSNGGRGSTTGIFIRGAKSNQIVLLVNGIRIGSATTGQARWAGIDTNSIERVEILRGPASALYGSDAVGGAINIITRAGKKGQNFTPYAEIAAGTHNYRKIAGGFSGANTNNTFLYSLHIGHEYENAISAKNKKIAKNNFELDRDPYTRNSLNGSLEWRFAPKWSARLDAHTTDGEFEYDSDSNLVSAKRDGQLKTYGVTIAGNITDSWHTSLRYAESKDHSDNLALNWQGKVAKSHFNTDRINHIWQNTIKTPVGNLIAGLEKQTEKVNSSTKYDNTERTVHSNFIGVEGNAGRHSWQANFRHDRNQQYGNRDTYYLAYGIRPIEDLSTHISYGTSFKAPSFNQLYWPGFGDTNLKPQTGKNWEIGAEYYWGNHTLGANWYYNKINQLITSGGGQQATNVDQAVMKGVSLSYRGQIGPWSGYTHLDIMDNKNLALKRRLNRTAKNMLKLGVDYDTKQWKAGTSILAISNRLDHLHNIKLGGYGLWDAYVAYSINKQLSVQLNLNNIGDKQYETAYGYNQPGRSAYLTLRYQGE